MPVNENGEWRCPIHGWHIVAGCYAIVVIDGAERILHKACAREFEREFGVAADNEVSIARSAQRP